MYTDISIYEVADGMVPVNWDVLFEILKESKATPEFQRNFYSYRRELRSNLEFVKDRYQRVVSNASRPRNWADTDWRIITKNGLEHPADALLATKRLMEAERELRNLVAVVLFRVWLWNMSGFHKRTWGPVPEIPSLKIEEVQELYERVRLAAANLARCYGQAALAEEISAAM